MRFCAVLISLLMLLAVAGCVEPQGNTPKDGGTDPHAWGKTYEDVTVPADFQPYDNPPFTREDSKAGKRIYGVYSYRTKTIFEAAKFVDWEKTELATHDWKFIKQELDTEKNTARLRFEKGDDKLDLWLAPDKVSSNDNFSILTVKMNDPNSK